MNKKIIIIIAALVIIVGVCMILLSNNNKDTEQIKADIEEFVSQIQDKSTIKSDFTKLGSSVLYENGIIIYVTSDDDVYDIELDESNKIKSITLNGDKNSQFYNSIHPDKHIPTGFKHKMGEWSTGYFISDEKGNEFVWIPVASKSLYKKILGAQNEIIPKGDYLGVTEILGEKVENSVTANMPEASIVNNAGGFWIGRYEAGVDSIEDASSIDWENAEILVKKNVQPVRCISADLILEKANNWKSEDGTGSNVAFQSGLVTGTQWDLACQFIGLDIANDDCSDWGCYLTTESENYTGYHSNDKSSDWVYDENAVKNGTDSGQSWVLPTGKFINNKGENTCKKNIYDMAGNVWECTTEVLQNETNNEHIIRGGGAGDTGNISATARARVQSNVWNVGMRLVLYVK